MPVRLHTEVDTKAMELVIRHFPDEWRRQGRDALSHIKKHFFKHWRRERLMGPPGIKARPKGIFWQFKSFINDIAYRHGRNTISIQETELEIWTTSKIALLHEKGGPVEALSGRLAVPLKARKEMFKNDGGLRKKYKRPAELPNVEEIKIKNKYFLAKVMKRTGEIRPLYVLKKRVMLRPRLGFYKTWDDQTNWRLDRINRAIFNALRSV